MVTNGSSGSAHIFVSHSTSDKALADGLTDAIEGLCPGRIDVYHSSRDGSRGVSAGDEWFKWILREVRQADVTIVLLTPASLERPWLMWETGAVWGSVWCC